MKRKWTRIVSGGTVLALVLAAAFAASASANPLWRFNGNQLMGSEEIAGEATGSTITIPGLTVECQTLSYEMKIFNMTGTGRGELNSMSFANCTANSPSCTIASMTAGTFPWNLHLAAVGVNSYVVLEGVRINILFSGEECALDEVLAQVTGTAGGLFDNSTSEVIFSPTTFSATATQLKTLGVKALWNCVLTTQAQLGHSGEALEAW